MSVCEVPVVSSVCHAASKAVSSVVSAPFEWIAEGVGGAAAWMFKGVWQLFESTTLVNLSEPGYLKVYDVLFGVAIFLMLLFFSLQLITGLIHRDPGALQRAAIGLAKSVLGSFLVVTVVGLALAITDELCVGIVQATGNTLEEMGGKIAALATGVGAISLSAPGAGAVIIIFLGCLAITGAAIVWFSLLTRKALLLVAVVLAPIALSGQSWDAARGWVSKWASFVVALIVSKLVVVVIFLVAINQMNAPIDLDLSSIANPVAGIVLMFIAAFAPYMAYKFISFIGIDVTHAMSLESEAKQATGRPLSVPGSSLMGSARKILGGDPADGAGGGDAGTSQPGGRGGGGAPRAGGQGGGGAFPGGAADSWAASGVPGPVGATTGTAAGTGAGGGAAGSAGGAMALGGLAGAAQVTAAAKAAPAAGHAAARSAEQQAGAGQDVGAGAGIPSPHDPGRTAMGALPQVPSSSAPAEPQGPSQPDLPARMAPAPGGITAPTEPLAAPAPAAPASVSPSAATPAAPVPDSGDPGVAANQHAAPPPAPAPAPSVEPPSEGRDG